MPEIIETTVYTASAIDTTSASAETVEKSKSNAVVVDESTESTSSQQVATASATADNVVVKNGYSPFIGDNGNWWQWNTAIQAYQDTKIPATSSGTISLLTSYNELSNLPTLNGQSIKGDITNEIKAFLKDVEIDLSDYVTYAYLNQQISKIAVISVPDWALQDEKPEYSIREIRRHSTVAETGSYSDLTDVPETMPNPYSLTIKGLDNDVVYDGSNAVELTLDTSLMSVGDEIEVTTDSIPTSKAVMNFVGQLTQGFTVNTTYTMSIDGTTVTLTGSDGSTQTIEIPTESTDISELRSLITDLQTKVSELETWKEEVLNGTTIVPIET